jgi:hypothetical protein
VGNGPGPGPAGATVNAPDAVKTPLTARRRARRWVDTSDYGRMLRRMVTAYGRRVATGDIEDLADLLALAAFVEDTARAAITQRRQADNSFSWAVVAEATGTTRQAAQQRWSPRPERPGCPGQEVLFPTN